MTSYDPNQYPSDGYPGQPYPQDQSYPGQVYPQDQGYAGQAYQQSQGYAGQAYQQGQPYAGQAYPQDQGYAGQAYQQGQPYAGQPLYPMMAQNTEKNSLGVWAVSLGAASVLCCGIFTGIPAAILGFLGLQAANEGRANNKGMSIAGIVLGGLSIVSMILLNAFGIYDSFLS